MQPGTPQHGGGAGFFRNQEVVLRAHRRAHADLAGQHSHRNRQQQRQADRQQPDQGAGSLIDGHPKAPHRGRFGRACSGSQPPAQRIRADAGHDEKDEGQRHDEDDEAHGRHEGHAEVLKNRFF